MSIVIIFILLVWIDSHIFVGFSVPSYTISGSKDFLSSVYFNSNLPFETLTFL